MITYAPKWIRPHERSAPGQKAKCSVRANVFRFAPESGLKSNTTQGLKRADNGHFCQRSDRITFGDLAAFLLRSRVDMLGPLGTLEGSRQQTGHHGHDRQAG